MVSPMNVALQSGPRLPVDVKSTTGVDFRNGLAHRGISTTAAFRRCDGGVTRIRHAMKGGM